MLGDYDLWREMKRMQDQMDALFHNFFRSDQIGDSDMLLENKGDDYRFPASDVYETDKEVVAEIDLPGIDKKDIKVNIADDSVEVKAERKEEVEHGDKKKGTYRKERSCSGYYRKFNLPSRVDADSAEAEYKNGVLKIKAPRKKIEEKKKNLLEVK